MKFRSILAIAFFPILTSISVSATPDAGKIGKILDSFVSDAENTGTLLLVEEGGKTVSFAKGSSAPEKKVKATTGDLFEIGSASKMFTAIATLQLVEQGKLSLSDTMDKLFPDGKYKPLANYKGANYWDKITVEMLLNHTSGMIDYLNVYGDDATAMKKLAIKGKTYTADDLVALAISHGDANFKPGTQFKYCNTGYTLLGEIITKKSGVNWRDYIEQHIIKPADMTDTYFGSRLPESALKRKMASRFNGKPSFMPPTLAGAAGEIVSNLADLQKFLHAWQSGKLFQKTETLQMQRTKGFHKMGDAEGLFEYGYGVMKIKGFFGHGGQTFGFQSYLAMNPESKNLCVVGVNDAAVPAMALFRSVEGIK